MMLTLLTSDAAERHFTVLNTSVRAAVMSSCLPAADSRATSCSCLAFPPLRSSPGSYRSSQARTSPSQAVCKSSLPLESGVPDRNGQEDLVLARRVVEDVVALCSETC